MLLRLLKVAKSRGLVWAPSGLHSGPRFACWAWALLVNWLIDPFLRNASSIPGQVLVVRNFAKQLHVCLEAKPALAAGDAGRLLATCARAARPQVARWRTGRTGCHFHVGGGSLYKVYAVPRLCLMPPSCPGEDADKKPMSKGIGTKVPENFNASGLASVSSAPVIA